jgi:hypothetical protein
VTTKHLWKAARVSDLRATTTHQLLNNNRKSSIALPHFSKVVRKREIIFITFERENDERRFVDKIFFFIVFLTSSSQ